MASLVMCGEEKINSVIYEGDTYTLNLSYLELSSAGKNYVPKTFHILNFCMLKRIPNILNISYPEFL